VTGPIEQYKTLQFYAGVVGWSAAFRIRLHDLVTRRFKFMRSFEIRLKIKDIDYPLSMRTGTSSDREVLQQIFVHPEYEPVAVANPAVIIDLGANVGYSSAYFLSRYPTTKVVAVEPDHENFLICQRNLAPYGDRVKVLHGAVWPEKKPLALKKGSFGDGREWATQVCASRDSEIGGPEVQGYDMDSLIELSGSHNIDLLKIDIERSEVELFSRNTEGWLPKIRNICIELHDDECAAVFFAALSGCAYKSSRSGELTVCGDLRPLNGDFLGDASIASGESDPLKEN
jgi:FkbM family methyltransferase